MLVPARIASLLLSFTLGAALLSFMKVHSLHTSAHTAIYSILFLYRNTRARLILSASLSPSLVDHPHGVILRCTVQMVAYEIQRWDFFSLPRLTDGFSRLTFTSTSKP